jgi:hypothetical protein
MLGIIVVSWALLYMVANASGNLFMSTRFPSILNQLLAIRYATVVSSQPALFGSVVTYNLCDLAKMIYTNGMSSSDIVWYIHHGGVIGFLMLVDRQTPRFASFALGFAITEASSLAYSCLGMVHTYRPNRYTKHMSLALLIVYIILRAGVCVYLGNHYVNELWSMAVWDDTDLIMTSCFACLLFMPFSLCSIVTLVNQHNKY